MCVQPVILAGGVGSRLWPISTPSLPKQFIKFDSKRSYFQKTIGRLDVFSKPIIIANTFHKEIVMQQIAEINKDVFLVFEPSISNTYIPFLIGAVVASRVTNHNVGFIPSDHQIDSTEHFCRTIHLADLAAQDDIMVTIGVKADHISDQYGHIISNSIVNNVHKCVDFIEKPNHLECRFLESIRRDTDIFWNSGIYLSSQNFFMTHFKDTLSLIDNICPSLESGILCVPATLYQHIPQGSFDKIFMSKLKNFHMLTALFEWFDIGNYRNFILSNEIIKNIPPC